MTCGNQFSGGPALRDHAVNHPGVLAVDPADPPELTEFLQGPIEVPVSQHHGGIGHIHFERGNPLGKHIRQLAPDGLIPVVDGHMKAVVAEGLSIGLFPPPLQTAVQALTFVRAGEVDHRGSTAPQRRPASGGESVRGNGPGDFQVKMGVGVHKAREEVAAGNVDDPVRLGLEIPSQSRDLLILHQQGSPPDPSARNHRAAFEQCTHTHSSALFSRRPRPLRKAAASDLQYTTLFRKFPPHSASETAFFRQIFQKPPGVQGCAS